MTAELSPKIWEFTVPNVNNPELVLDYFGDNTINFFAVAGAIEQIVGVEWVEVSSIGHKMRVILRNSDDIYNKLAPIFEKIYGIRPIHGWRHADAQL